MENLTESEIKKLNGINTNTIKIGLGDKIQEIINHINKTIGVKPTETIIGDKPSLVNPEAYTQSKQNNK